MSKNLKDSLMNKVHEGGEALERAQKRNELTCVLAARGLPTAVATAVSLTRQMRYLLCLSTLLSPYNWGLSFHQLFHLCALPFSLTVILILDISLEI